MLTFTGDSFERSVQDETGIKPAWSAEAFTGDAFKRSVQDETGIKPAWSAEAFTDLDEDVRLWLSRIKASPFILYTDTIRGFVLDVATGKLNEVS